PQKNDSQNKEALIPCPIPDSIPGDTLDLNMGFQRIHEHKRELFASNPNFQQTFLIFIFHPNVNPIFTSNLPTKG
ncbi:MAG: hypothetical protein ACI86C_001914, partial [Candidatus Latescibacterota bacterium]